MRQRSADRGCIKTEHVAYGIEREKVFFVVVRDPVGGLLRTCAGINPSGEGRIPVPAIED